MSVETRDTKPLSPWQPMTDQVALAVLGKLAEEAAELISAASRCVIQGAHEVEPVTGKPNLAWLAEEIADVLANAEKVTEHFGLDRAAIKARADMKLGRLHRWHPMIGLSPSNEESQTNGS